MFRNRTISAWAASVIALAAITVSATAPVHAQVTKTPDALIKEVSTDVLETLKKDSIKPGDTQKVMTLVDQKVMPYVDFQRMTASAVGRYWRQASPEQQKQLQEQFKTLLVRTYSGALSQVADNQTIELQPMRSNAEDKEVVVRSQVKGKGDPIQLDYRLEQTGSGWKIYDVSVLGVWLVENYRNSFAQEIGANGVDGLIKKLVERNSKPTAGAPAKS